MGHAKGGPEVKANVEFSWMRSADELEDAARLFARHVQPAYISHSELQGPRAIAPGQWSEGLEDILRQDIAGRLANPLDAAERGTTQLAAVAHLDRKLAGVFLVTFARDGATPYAILEDMVVDEGLRGAGIGTKYMAWIDEQCRQRKIFRQFLESGGSNHKAHDLFARKGFRQLSIVMMKEL